MKIDTDSSNFFGEIWNFPKAKGIPPVAAARDVLREQKAMLN
jgi:hypothetical protein